MVGDCNPDVLVLGADVTPSFGQREKLVEGIWMVIGGSAAITAVAAARLGLSVELVAAVGADPAGDFLLGQLSRQGVGTTAMAVRDDVPTGMTVALSRGADRAILTALGAVATLAAEDVPAGLLAQARHVHVSSYFLLEHSLGTGLAAMLAAARAAGATVSLDTNWDPSGKWGDDRLSASLAQADVLLPNEAEALRIAGEPTLSAAAQALAAAGPKLAIKLGERGVLCADGPVWHRAELPPIEPVDATGAGDCFNAGLIAGLLHGLALPAAAALGCAVGALSTQAPGGTASCPDLASAQALAKTATVRSVSARTLSGEFGRDRPDL